MRSFPISIFFFSEKSDSFFGFRYFKEDKTRRIYWLWKSIALYWDIKMLVKSNEIENLELWLKEKGKTENNFFSSFLGVKNEFNEKKFIMIKKLKINCCVDFFMNYFSLPNLETLIIWEKKKIMGCNWKKKNLSKLKKVKIRHDILDLKFKNSIFRKNELFALNSNYFDLELIDESLRKKKTFILKIVKKNYYFFDFIDESLKRDKEIVLAVVQQKGDF